MGGIRQENFSGEVNKETFDEKVRKVISVLREKYQLDIEGYNPEPYLVTQLTKIQEVFGDLENVKGKKILDLGCGSRIDDDTLEIMKKIEDESLQKKSLEDQLRERGKFDTGTSDGEFQPWMSRILLELGANPTGIDIGSNEGEEFEHYQIDLSKSGALDFLPNKSFDGVNMRLLLNSPQLLETTSQEQIEEMKTELMKQIKRLLKDDGKVIYLHEHMNNK